MMSIVRALLLELPSRRPWCFLEVGLHVPCYELSGHE